MRKFSGAILLILLQYAIQKSLAINMSLCDELPREYDDDSCKVYWKCSVENLLLSWSKKNQGFHRSDLANLNAQDLEHTPMWLRVIEDKLYCVKSRSLQGKNLTLKVYRARHYVNRLNRILGEVGRIPNMTEWWTHHADRAKVKIDAFPFPIFSVAGAPGRADIAGIPFMSFSDSLSKSEDRFFGAYSKFQMPWKKRVSSAFFRGALSDCGVAREFHSGKVEFCRRAKIVHEASRNNNSLLKNVHSTTNFRTSGLNMSCVKCQRRSYSSEKFAENLLKHKYLLNLPGAGPWSRRMNLLLRSGGLIFQEESAGHQFFEVELKPGAHYIPFDSEIGRAGVGNLISRLEWAKKNDDIAESIATRSRSFGMQCLTEY